MRSETTQPSRFPINPQRLPSRPSTRSSSSHGLIGERATQHQGGYHGGYRGRTVAVAGDRGRGSSRGRGAWRGASRPPPISLDESRYQAMSYGAMVKTNADLDHVVERLETIAWVDAMTPPTTSEIRDIPLNLWEESEDENADLGRRGRDARDDRTGRISENQSRGGVRGGRSDDAVSGKMIADGGNPERRQGVGGRGYSDNSASSQNFRGGAPRGRWPARGQGGYTGHGALYSPSWTNSRRPFTPTTIASFSTPRVPSNPRRLQPLMTPARVDSHDARGRGRGRGRGRPISRVGVSQPPKTREQNPLSKYSFTPNRFSLGVMNSKREFRAVS